MGVGISGIQLRRLLKLRQGFLEVVHVHQTAPQAEHADLSIRVQALKFAKLRYRLRYVVVIHEVGTEIMPRIEARWIEFLDLPVGSNTLFKIAHFVVRKANIVQSIEIRGIEAGSFLKLGVGGCPLAFIEI